MTNNNVENGQFICFIGESSKPYKSMTIEEATKYMYNGECRDIEAEGKTISEAILADICSEYSIEIDSIHEKFSSFVLKSEENDTEENKLMTVEEKKSSMVKSFKKNIQENINSIKRTSARANDEAINMVVEDRVTFKDFIPALRDKNNLEGFVGIKDFVFPNEKFSSCIDTVLNASDTVVNIHKKYMNYILQANSVDSLRKYYAEFSDALTSQIDDVIDEKTHSNIVPKDRWVPTLKDISFMVRFINNPSTITCSIADGCRQTTSNLVKIANNANSIFNRVAESELDVARLNYLYRCTSLSNRKIASIFIQFKDLTIREIAAYRKAVMIAGKYANDKMNNKKRSVKEWTEMIDYMSESSDIFVQDSMDIVMETASDMVELNTLLEMECLAAMSRIVVESVISEANEEQSVEAYLSKIKESINTSWDDSKKYFENMITKIEGDVSNNQGYTLSSKMIDNVKPNTVFASIHSFDILDNMRPGSKFLSFLGQIDRELSGSSDISTTSKSLQLTMYKSIAGLEVDSSREIDEHYKNYLVGNIIKIDKNWLNMNLKSMKDIVIGNGFVNLVKDLYATENKAYKAALQYVSEFGKNISNSYNAIFLSLLMRSLSIMHKCDVIVVAAYQRKFTEYKGLVSRLNRHYSVNEASEAQGTSEDDTDKYDMKPEELAKSAQNNSAPAVTEPDGNSTTNNNTPVQESVSIETSDLFG